MNYDLFQKYFGIKVSCIFEQLFHCATFNLVNTIDPIQKIVRCPILTLNLFFDGCRSNILNIDIHDDGFDHISTGSEVSGVNVAQELGTARVGFLGGFAIRVQKNQLDRVRASVVAHRQCWAGWSGRLRRILQEPDNL